MFKSLLYVSTIVAISSTTCFATELHCVPPSGAAAEGFDADITPKHIIISNAPAHDNYLSDGTFTGDGTVTAQGNQYYILSPNTTGGGGIQFQVNLGRKFIKIVSGGTIAYYKCQ